MNRTEEYRALVKADTGGNVVRQRLGAKDVRETPSEYEREARSVFADIQRASLLVKTAETRGSLSAAENTGLQEVLDVATGRVAVLQQSAESRAQRRRELHAQDAGIISRVMSLASGESAASMLDRHEAAVAWFLGHRLSLLTRRLEAVRAKADAAGRIRERISVLRETASSRATVPSAGILDDNSDQTNHHAERPTLSAQQLQQLSTENESLLAELQQTHAAVERSAATLSEISRLQSTLQEQLVFQAAQIDRLHADAEMTVDTLGRANEQLTAAGQRQVTSARLLLWLFIFSALIVLILHFAI